MPTRSSRYICRNAFRVVALESLPRRTSAWHHCTSRSTCAWLCVSQCWHGTTSASRLSMHAVDLGLVDVEVKDGHCDHMACTQHVEHALLDDRRVTRRTERESTTRRGRAPRGEDAVVVFMLSMLLRRSPAESASLAHPAGAGAVGCRRRMRRGGA